MSTKLLPRCRWVDVNKDIYREYHDNEWGEPVQEDKLLFEMLLLESFQSGISWLIVLNKREAFRKAFDNFDPVLIKDYNESKINSLMQEESIIRSKAKINAAIVNARVFLSIKDEYGSFGAYLWRFTNNRVIKNVSDKIPTKNELSDMVSNDMKKRGMKFLGSVTIYSYLAAVGIINDHETRCYKY
ncbi:DNA-3-methyladenine glycosylase I [Clostridia bacterium]|nr:DNA-3-methyladenine glycosylase I [Clostridia bacterium]